VILADRAGPAPLERFVRESRACAQLRHPNIVSILDYNADDPQRPFLVMELLSGPSLKDELAQRVRLPSRDCSASCRRVCSALALAPRARHHPPRSEAGEHRRARFRRRRRVYKVVDFGVADRPQSATRRA
jgi:serine/threonine protein kinase